VVTILNWVAKSSGPEVSEANFVHSVVNDFANGGALNAVLRSVPGVQDPIAFGELRERFRTDLQAIVEKRMTPAMRARIGAQAVRVVQVPQGRLGEGETFRYLPESLQAALAQVLKLIIDKGYAADLRQCRLPACGQVTGARPQLDRRRFFFVSLRREATGKTTGRLPDQYCSPEHMQVAHRARATAATLRRRRELREQRDAKSRNQAGHRKPRST
jgi:hypothetical protein